MQVSLEDVEALAIGAGILGTGGGGNTYLAKVSLAREFRLRGTACPIIDVDELSDHALVCAISGMGAPTVGIEKLPNGNEMVNGIRALEAHLRRSFDALIIGEIGGSNGLRPLLAGLQLGLPVVDGDPMGRAFPELQMDTFAIGGVSPSPMLLCDVQGNTIIVDHIDTAKRAEEYARQLTIEMGGSAALIMPVLSGKQAKQFIIRGTLSLALRLGRIVLQARRDSVDPAERAAAAANGTLLFRGKIVDLIRRTSGGFARGQVKLAAFEASADLLEIEFQNENLVARRGGKAVCSVPDLITILSLEDGEPVGTEALRYGLRVAVLAMPAPKELKTPAALAVVGPAAFGYPDVAYTPLPGDLL